MADTTALQRLRVIVLKLFPWLARIGLAPSGALAIKSAVARIEIEGDAKSPAAARVGDATDGGGLAFFPGVPSTTAPSLWYTASQKAPYVWTLVDVTIITGPIPSDSGTRIAGVVTTGSAKVKCG